MQKKIEHDFKSAGYRCETDERSEKIGYKIREAQLNQIPYMVIVGEKESESRTISIRKRDQGDIGSSTIQEFLALLEKELADL